MKKFAWILMVILALMLQGCSSTMDNADGALSAGSYYETTLTPNITETTLTPNITETTLTPTITETTEPRLSAACQKILCIGKDDDDGDVYEIVGNQYETYKGFEIQVGVIKNNEWLVPMSAESPLIDKSGLVVGVGSLKDDNSKICYISEGCFYFGDEIFWPLGRVKKGTFYNAEINKTASIKTEYMNDGLFLGADYRHPYDNKYVIRKNVDGGYDFDIRILDISTMEITEIADSVDVNVIGPYSDGVFLAGNAGVYVFYDANFTAVLDLSQYMDYSPEFDRYKGFYEGKCTFYVYNELGTKWEITIDLEGNILEEKLVKD